MFRRRWWGIGKEYRVNEQIKAAEVRLIGENGEQLGIMPSKEALRIARERGFDLVEVAPNAAPPVCRLLNYSKFKYEQAKKEKLARKHQKVGELSEVRMRPRIDPHDMEFKIKHIKRLLERGDKVKVMITFRGREIIHPDLGHKLLQKVIDSLEAVKVERPPTMEGHNLSLLLSKKSKAGG